MTHEQREALKILIDAAYDRALDLETQDEPESAQKIRDAIALMQKEG